MTNQERPSGSNGEIPPTSEAVRAGLAVLIFEFLEQKYIQRADARQKEMGLQYMTAETHDLSRELAKFMTTRLIHIKDPF